MTFVLILLAIQNFVPRLEDHLLSRMMDLTFSGDTENNFSDEDRRSVRFKKMYETKTFRVNYTTYDIRRDQDYINSDKRADIMVHSPEVKDNPRAHPYWYGRVLLVFHIDASSSLNTLNGKFLQSQKFEVLLVRWYGILNSERCGARIGRLPKVGFVDEEDDYAFSFLNPLHVIRACHLMPSFNDGEMQLLKTVNPTIARRKGAGIEEWEFYYVGMYV